MSARRETSPDESTASWTLCDFFDRYIGGEGIALLHDDGLRRWTYSGAQLRGAAEAVAARLAAAGFGHGDRMLIWGESRPEWVAAFWGCVLRGVALVPVEPSASPALAARLARLASVRGAVVDDEREPHLPPGLRAWPMRELAWSAARIPGVDGRVRAPVDPSMVAEVVFTSGTTALPKGVLITHGNILANVRPFEREAAAYRHLLWPLRPLRFLSVLPLSHMFGQALSLFLPPVVGATVVFVRGSSPARLARAAAAYRVTLVVTVPRVLALTAAWLRRTQPGGALTSGRADAPLAARLWRARRIHRRFGWRMCGFVVGGAPLGRDLEDFWQRLGYAVIQGYGLTETAPIVAWNHPFALRHGTVGRPLEGTEVRLAEDGEVLVKGPSVSQGYLGASAETRVAFSDGWFHTGDLGEFDASGRLRILGRKKDVITTADGLKVHPEDVEQVLDRTIGVREAAVIGRPADGAEVVHAVAVLEPGTDPAQVVRSANAQLEPHQRVRDLSIWPGALLPRTEPMHKLKRFEIRRWLEQGERRPPVPPSGRNQLETALARLVGARALHPEATLDELGLTSLDRVELLVALEDAGAGLISDAALARVRTVRELTDLVRVGTVEASAPATMTFPEWTTNPLARTVRRLCWSAWVLPLVRHYVKADVRGLDHLRAVDGPVLFASTHQSHLDTPVILDALPAAWRQRIAVAMWKEYFDAYFSPQRHPLGTRWRVAIQYYLATLLFNAFPLPVSEPGAPDAIRYMGDLVSDGWSLLIFPEGERTDGGEIRPFQPGVGLAAARLRLPVVPVRVDGLHHILHRSWRWPRRGTATVTFGPPLVLAGTDYNKLAQQIRDAVCALAPAGNAPTAAILAAPGTASKTGGR